MARSAKPWRRKGTGGAWYAQVHGKQVRLADASATKTEAHLRLHKLLARTGSKQPIKLGQQLTLGTAVKIYREARTALGPLDDTVLQTSLGNLPSAPSDFLRLPSSRHFHLRMTPRVGGRRGQSTSAGRLAGPAPPAIGSCSSPRSPAAWSTRASCRSTAWAPRTTAGRFL